ncbi:MAG: hypothetical protein AB9897_05400 [Anaerolineaceae bacterium]
MTNRKDLTRQKVYKKIANAALKNDQKHLSAAIDSIPDEFVDSPENDISSNEWKSMIEEIHFVKRTKQQIAISLFIFGAILIFVVGGFLIWKNFDSIKARIGKTTEEPTLAVITSAPTTLATIEISPTPTIQLPTPTPLPDSDYKQLDTSAIVPAVPLAGKAYWVIPGTSATTDADMTTWGWYTTPITYTILPDVKVTWKMDKPFNTDGEFAVYYVDSVTGALGQYQFVVSNGDQVIEPTRGSGIVDLLGRYAAPQDDWSLLGYYHFTPGQELIFSATTKKDMTDLAFALNDLLIIQLSEHDQLILDALPTARKMVFLEDNTGAETFSGTANADGSIKWESATDNWQSVSQSDAWGGEFLARSAGWESPLQVHYPVEKLINGGKYELMVWVPENNSAQVTYSIYLDGIYLEPDTDRTITQGKIKSEWVSLGIWDIAKPGKLSVYMDIAADAQGTSQIGVDAIALLQVEE